ncbi:MAG: hypothetical protein IKC04_00175, partial [Oscillospiraceae bacterium]|nr:hypothetical protein [Oscillospiraceae bacterium]
ACLRLSADLFRRSGVAAACHTQSMAARLRLAPTKNLSPIALGSYRQRPLFTLSNRCKATAEYTIEKKPSVSCAANWLRREKRES